MDTYRNPDDIHAARALAAALILTFATGITTSLFPTAEPAIITAAVVLGLAWLLARVIAWRVRERRLDQADARAAYLARQHAAGTVTGASSDRGAA